MTLTTAVKFKEFQGRFSGESKRGAIRLTLKIPNRGGEVNVWVRPFSTLLINDVSSDILRVESGDAPMGWEKGPTGNEIIAVIEMAIAQASEAKAEDRRLR